jgi:anti-sigma regulatory factor (Ser/Thr protein kinase)/putative methionine-R-sulfoxide reductase with GAF domain
MTASSPDPATDDRIRQFESVTEAALAHLGLEDLLDVLLERVTEMLGADTAAILLFDPDARVLVATAARGLEEEVRQGVRIPVGTGFAGRIAAEKAPVVLDHVDSTTVVNPILIDKGISSLLGVPLLAAGEVLGVLHVGTLEPRGFTEEDAALLQVVADRVALATAAALSVTERSAARALQRSLVPSRLPVIEGLDLAARYAPAAAGAVGGDWYDVFALPTGWVCIVVGDVTGQGLRAAVVMGRLRSALRAYALETYDPAEVLARLDRKLAHFEPGELATVQCAMVEPSLGTVHVSSAGHLPPVIALPDGTTEVVALENDPPIGVRLARRRTSRAIDLPHDAVLCFYTDGLVERRGEPIDVGLERLLGAARPATSARSAESVAVGLMSRLGSVLFQDDVALLVVRRRGRHDFGPDALELEIPNRPSALADLRASARRWLADVGVDRDRIGDIILAVGEAASNAVAHAYGPEGGTVSVALALDGPSVVATVEDTGSWRPARGRNRGRGITIMREVSDELEVDHGDGGTSVTMRFGISQDTT